MKKMKINCKKIVKLFLIFCLTFSLNSFAYPSAEPPLSISGKLSKSTAVGIHFEEVVIEVSGTKNMTVKPDRFGNYMVRNLPRGGTYTIKPTIKGFSFSPASRTYRGLTESKINEDYIPSEQTFSISGKVLAGGKPVKGITVMISHRSNKYFTDQDGHYNIDHLEYNGPYTVSVISDTYNYEPFTIDFLDKNVTHDFTKDISLSGYITSFDNPVKNIEINVNGVKYKTDENGKYIVKGVAAGIDCKIMLSNEELTANPAYISLTRVSNDKENLNFDISGTMSGKVTYNNAPFKNAIVKIKEINKINKTSESGEFNFSDLAVDQEYTVSVSSTGYMFEPSEWKVKNLAVEKNKKDFVASVKKYKANIIARKGEKPIPGATVTLLETKKTFTTDAQGKCVIPALKFGTKYNISIKKEGFSFVEAKQTIENNNDRDLDVFFGVALSVSGIVKKDLKPIANAIVVCGDQKVKTNVKGQYTLKGLRPNADYTVSVSSGSLVFDENPIVLENLIDSKNNVNFVIDTKKKAEEEKLRLAKEAELKAQEEAKQKEEELRLAKEAEEARLKAEKEEQERLAKEAELKAQEEAKQKEEELRLAKEAEEAKIKAEKEEQERLAKEAELKAQEEARLAKEAEEARLKAEKEEQERLAKEAELKAQEEARLAKEAEKARLKAEKEEQMKLAKEEKLKAQEEAKKKAEEARLAKEAEKARLKAEKEEQMKLAKEEKLKAQEEAKKKAEEARLAKEAEKARLKAEKEEMAKLAKDEAKKKALEKEEQVKLAKESKIKLQEEAKIKAEEERLAKEAEVARIKAEKEEAERLAKEAELKAQEEAKIKAEEERLAKEAEAARIKAEKEEAERLAKEAELKAQEEAKIKAEEERLAKEVEAARIKAEKEEAERLAKEAELKAQEEAKIKAEEERLAKEAEAARIKAEKEEAERLAKEAELKAQEEAKIKAEEERLAKEAEAARIKAEKEEQARLAKEEKLRAQEEAKKKAEEEKLAKEAEKARIKAEKEEQARLAKEEKLRIQEEERLAKEAEEARIKAEKEEAERLAKEAELEAKEAEEAKKKAEEERLAKEAEKESKVVSIRGRILKGKNGVPGVQVRVLTEDEEKIYLTNKNGFYKITNLVKDENYTITVVSGKTAFDISPKVRVYKKISGNLTNQNFYVVEDYNKGAADNKNTKNSTSKNVENKNDSNYWNDSYGIKNKDGVIQKDIEW